MNKKEDMKRTGRFLGLRALISLALVLAMTLTFTFADKTSEELEEEIEQKIDELEATLNGTGARKIVGIVPRNW